LSTSGSISVTDGTASAITLDGQISAGGLTVNVGLGGAGTSVLNFAIAATSDITGNVLINGPASGTATLNVTDPVAAAVGGTFTIDFGAGHTGSESLNITPAGADTAVVTTSVGVPTGVSFSGGTGVVSWVLDDFILGQDHIPGYGF